ncbi:MAG: rod shape-determining protein RodA [Verrucomicrobiota bacterium]|nr:rod shape-determining protein RodA [Verrucomicrobiota bacterium]
MDFNPKKIFNQSWTLFFCAMALCAIGILFIKSAQSGTEIVSLNTAWESQLHWMGLGFLAYFFVMMFDFRKIIILAPHFYCVSLVLLILVLLPTPWSKEINNSKSWLFFGSFHIQPSEVAKVSLILLLAYVLSFPKQDHRKIIYLIISLAILGVPLLLVLKQPDLGSAMVMLPVTFIIMFIVGIPKRYLISLILAGCVFCVAVYNDFVPGFKLKEYQKKRLTSFLDPEADARGSGFMILQMKTAIGTGGTWGKGYGNSTQNKLGYLPRNVAHTDAIFAVVAEEIGFVGSCSILFLFTIMMGIIIRIATRTTELSGRILCIGVAMIIFTHFFQNIGMTVGVMPITGIPLPFISHGGSFLIITLSALGIVQSVWIHRKSYQPPANAAGYYNPSRK